MRAGAGTIAAATASAALALAIAAPARADVMEVGEGSFNWVAGGPRAPEPPPASAPHTFAPSTSRAPVQWRSHLDRLSARYDISPSLLEALVWQESRWNPEATSPKGAHGLAQLMPGTARQLGVDPRNPAANLEGGARYLRQQIDAFGGNLEKALAAYNAGPGRVVKAGGVPRIPETQGYVAAIMARLADPVRR